MKKKKIESDTSMQGLNIVEKIEQAYLKKGLPEFRPGDTVRVFAKIREGEKERLQAFEGVVLRKHGGGSGASVTVRKISYGVGVERIFPVNSPVIDRIEIVQKGRVRRARLYYLRELTGKKARIETEESVTAKGETVVAKAKDIEAKNIAGEEKKKPKKPQ